MITKPAAVAAILLLAALGVSGALESPDVAYATLEDHVTRVIDGDTIELRGGETVRLLGIDTPETGEPFYTDAKLYLFSLVCHKDVRLELDETEYDTYYRLLAHVYVETEDGWVLANSEVVRAGLADLLFIPPNSRYYDYLEGVLWEAIIERRGLWGTISGTLSVLDLEADLIAYVTEVVTVSFVVGHVEETRNELVLHATEGDYGFNVRIPREIFSGLDAGSLARLVGASGTVTGFLACDIRIGPFITVEYSDQLVIDSNVPPEP